MQLYLSKEAADRLDEFLPLVKAAANAWNRAFSRDMIVVNGVDFSKEFGPSPTDPWNNDFYVDGVSVIYIVDRDFDGYALGQQAWDSQLDRIKIVEADVFVSINSFFFHSLGFLSTAVHELGHALGLGHLSLSDSMMSYNGVTGAIELLSPFNDLGLFGHEYIGITGSDWSYLFRANPTLWERLFAPSVHDKLMLSCLYDLAITGAE